MDEEEYGEVSAQAQKMAWGLSLGGTIPFIVLALSLAIGFQLPAFGANPTQALLTYSAIILSFLGGTRWGVALTRTEGRAASQVFVLAVLPALIGWACVVVGGATAYLILIVAFLLQLVWDYGAWCTDVMREWFVKLRITITAIVVIALLIAFFASL